MSSQNPRRIIYVIGSLDRGGTEQHLLLLAPALLKRGWQPMIVCLSHPGELARNMAAAGVPVLAPPATAPDGKPKWRRALTFLESALKLRRYLRHEPNAIVHFFLPAAYCLGAPVAMLTGARQLVMSRRSRNHYLDTKPLFRCLERWLHKQMKLLLGNSQAVVSDLLEEGAPAERTHLIYNGVEQGNFSCTPSRREAMRAALGLGQALTIVVTANLIPYKGHKDLLDALAFCKDTLGERWRLLLVGRDDGIGDGLKCLAIRHGIGDQVMFLGPRSDVADLLSAADLFILPSHEEGFSNAILEAMAAGLPVIATDVGGNAEAVVHGKTGLLVPSKTPQALASAVAELAKSAELRGAYGLAGLERVTTLFSMESCASAYDAIYRSRLH